MKMFFFGCVDRAGHFLFTNEGRQLWCKEQDELPFKFYVLDGGLLNQPEDENRLFLSHINGYTVMGKWDRTVDTRGACNCSFIVEGTYNLFQMQELAEKHFTKLWNRVKPKNL